MTVVQRSLAANVAVERVLSTAELASYQRAAQQVYVDRPVAEYAVSLATATRDPRRFRVPGVEGYVEYGASPRGSINMIHAGRALALLRGRNYVLPRDVFDIAKDVLRHRLVLSYRALAEEVTPDQILDAVLRTIPVPHIDLAARTA
jgi:MoxR-like ATPase